MKNISFYGSVLILFIVGCSSVKPTSFPPTMNVGGESTLPAFVATPEIPATQTSATPTEVAVSLPSCFAESNNEILLASITKGTVVNHGSKFTLLETQSNTTYEIPLISENSYTPNGSVSPNRDLLATIEFVINELRQFERMYLRIFNARGEMVEMVVFEIPGLYKIRWLDNENILLYTASTARDGTVLLINPFTKKQNYITNELPKFFDDSNLLFPNMKWLIEYSPNLEWGVYLKRDNSGDIATAFPSGPDISHAVYDFVANKTIWIPRYPNDFSEEPKWSPDGTKVVIEANNQFTIVTRDGTLQPILDETKPNGVNFPAWSPDGRYIAFWNSIKLMFYDLQENILHDLCINTHSDFRTPPFVWSPDSHYIFVAADSKTTSALIDIKENKVYKVSTNPIFYFPAGWMNSMP